MALVAINTSALPILGKIAKGQDIITKSTNNPNAPGNAAALAVFSTAQDNLVATNNAYEAARQDLAMLKSARDNALVGWNTGITGLAGVTQSVTEGNAEGILSTGFDVRSGPTPAPPLAAPGPVTVTLNGAPGVSKLKWPPVAEARSYVVEQSPDPITETSWVEVDTPTKASTEIGGAEPGKVVWFRVAYIGPNGTSPWSGPSSRPVM